MVPLQPWYTYNQGALTTMQQPASQDVKQQLTPKPELMVNFNDTWDHVG